MDVPPMRLIVAWVVVALAAVPVTQAGGSLAAQAPDTVTSALEGSVRGRFDGTVRSLGHALVEVRAGGFSRVAVADSAGRYEVFGLPTGEVRVRVTHAGHEPLALTVLLPPGEALNLDLELRGRPVQLEALEVSGDARPSDSVPDPERGVALSEVDLQSIDIAPGVGQPGLLDAVRALPGNDPAKATDVLFMRGSTTDLKLVLLDGVPVYTPFHVGGLLRSFEPSVLGRADLHVGGAPARYDGGLSHILELQTRVARRDRVRASASLDLLSASAAMETPLGARAGLMLSGRGLHGLGSVPLGGARPYGYRDILLTIDGEPAKGQSLAATGFWNAESVRLDFDQRPDDASWTNRAASVRYRGGLGGARLEVSAGASGYRAALPLQPGGEPGKPIPPALRASAEIGRTRVVAEASWGPGDQPLRTGVSFEHIAAAFSARDSAAEVASRASAATVGAYVDVTRSIAPALTLRAGLRADVFRGDAARLAPRAALHVELGPEALLTVAAGRYHQPTRTPDFEVERTLAEVADAGVQPGSLLPVATADHVVLSLDQRLGGRVALGLEGFWKRFEGLVASDETVRSSGVDVRVRTAGAAGTAWLGYGLSWFWSTVDFSGHASDFAGRHLLSAGLAGRLGGRFGGEARVAYGAGLPYTSIPFRGADYASADTQSEPGTAPTGASTLDSPLVGGLDEAFLRLDLELYADLSPEWGGRAWRVRPYIRILNALDRRDALFYTFQQWRPDSVTPLARRPVLPLLGVAISF